MRSVSILMISGSFNELPFFTKKTFWCINKTLEDSEINKISEKIIKETSKKFNAVLRS